MHDFGGFSDERLLDGRHVDQRAVGQHDRVRDLRADNPAPGVDRRKRPDATLLDSRPFADDRGAGDRRCHHRRTAADDNRAFETRAVVDASGDVTGERLEHQAVALEQVTQLAGVDPPARDDLAGDGATLVDQPLDGVGDLQLAAR